MLGLISLGGNFKESIRFKNLLPENFFSVAADSGARHFDSLGITPDLLVGDMDSISPELYQKHINSGIEVKKYDTRKNMTDSEIAVEYALEKGCDRLVLIGAFGNRPDHMFGNIMLSANLAGKGIPVTLTDGETYFYTISKYNSPFVYSLENSDENDVFSIVLAIGDISEVTIEGLEYKLENEPLEIGSNRCISNTIPLKKEPDEALGYATVSINKGVAFFIHCKKD